ncbi:MAG: DNA repair protein RecO [Candidatus Schekmanbacteria bacterium RIFCSPHIGHO2_02_FULL_38_11]|uniref:DNA repair protein RecO n=1 Tax=Candidatus Schekmanbacteria bacterium RIFCSPLOWO2_12_FULL_38_15 TaxID=1817883 RepID=A0A1F7SJM3_9BACT|nr:MAG: DNA repair protein RecO [Candidatus Schekmanbacteria bacterium GWA2_38_9]OGL50802.1 MAG: DNA repair protein RecO [Candidatus Schekmanbacteria bacterium RIFCSPLOWO2_02_FULL_38_14]OGL53438.1 MAG: DNA repair protein RecO [Candidatus Schekmanbacteria bacterium RIFCSPLOWO2_12_FULL_38_15]OGL55045.1 MAG: DNA repair protein RecO [Candidatus Schekmanbacteria bacterium RIFCSPHIGHO2_02_FULL_38_11]
MGIQRTKAIVLKSLNFAETDKIITLYTQSFGKIGTIAKGARRINSKFGSSLEPGTLLDVIFYEKESSNLSNVSQSSIIDSFREIRDDFTLLSGSFYILSAINEMTREKQSNYLLFNLLEESLLFLSKIGDVFKSIAFFEIKMLKILGYEPNLSECSECRKEIYGREVSFSVSGSSVVCKKCTEPWDNPVTVSMGTIKTLEKMKEWSIKKSINLKLSSTSMEEIKKILYPCIRYHLGKEIKARRFLENTHQEYSQVVAAEGNSFLGWE